MMARAFRSAAARRLLLPLIVLVPGSTLASGAGSDAPHERKSEPTIAAVLLPAKLSERYRYIPDFLKIGNKTIPGYLGSIQVINGFYFTLEPSNRIMFYRGEYFVVPANSKFTSALYGNFCGPGWGVGNGGETRRALDDGGLDAACQQHDIAWSNQAPQNILRGDQIFLSELQRIAPRWSYERDYIESAVRWIGCRVQRGTVTTALSAGDPCSRLGVRLTFSSIMSRIVRQ